MVWSLADNSAWQRNPAGSNKLIANPDQRPIKQLNQTKCRSGVEERKKKQTGIQFFHPQETYMALEEKTAVWLF